MASSLSMFLGAVTTALVLAAPFALAADPDYLQDLCVADLSSGKLRDPYFAVVYCRSATLERMLLGFGYLCCVIVSSAVEIPMDTFEDMGSCISLLISV
jgi:hypothetical protein